MGSEWNYGDYPWSSYRAHANGMPDSLVSDHDLYRRLGRSEAERQAGYRDLLDTVLDPEFVEALRSASNGGWVLGSNAFKKQVAEALKRRVAPLPKAHPPKDDPDDRQINLL